MINIEPFTIDHYRKMIVQPAQEYIGEFVTEEHVRTLSQHPSFAGMSQGGRVLGAAGLHAGWEGRATVWALLSPKLTTGEFLAAHKAIKKFLDAQPYRRIEATVDCEFPEAHKWVKMLGFRQECERMAKYDPAGRDHALYARIR